MDGAQATADAAADEASSPRTELVEWLRIVLAAGAFAVPAALVSVLFIVLVRVLTDLAWVRLPEAAAIPQPALLLGIPIVGALIVGVIVRFAPGHGGPDPASGHGLGGAAGEMRDLPGVVGAAAVGLASGASLGPEGPLSSVLSTLGAATGRVLRLPPETGPLLGIAGLSSLLGGIFGNPLAVGLFLVEMSPATGHALYRRIIPALVAATVGAIVFTAITGGAFAAFEFLPYEGLKIWHLAAAIVLGGVAAVLGLGYIQLVKRMRQALRPLDARVITKLLVGGVGVGLIALVVGELTLFSGEQEINTVMSQGEAMGVAALLFLLLGKTLAAALSLSAGYRGGRIFPVLFLGGTLGMAIHVALPWIPAALAISTGMAGIGVTVMRAPIFLVTFLVIITSPEMVPAMLFAAITAWVISDGREEL